VTTGRRRVVAPGAQPAVVPLRRAGAARLPPGEYPADIVEGQAFGVDELDAEPDPPYFTTAVSRYRPIAVAPASAVTGTSPICSPSSRRRSRASSADAGLRLAPTPQCCSAGLLRRAISRPSRRSARRAASRVQRGSDRSDGPSAVGMTVTPRVVFRTWLGVWGRRAAW